MLRISALERGEAVWLVFEARGNSPFFADLNAIEFPAVGDKGVVIVSALDAWVTDSAILQYGSARWLGRYVPKRRGGRNERDHGVLVVRSIDPAYPVGLVLDQRLLCLECWREGVERELRTDAIYPYCAAHQNHNPGRQGYIPKRQQKTAVGFSIPTAASDEGPR